MTRIRLIIATPSHLLAFQRDPASLAALLGSPLPEGWPEFPEAIPYTLEVMTNGPADADWWMRFFIDADSGALVGSGGFAGPPAGGVVEIGYEIAPAFRRRGFATAAVTALVHEARQSGRVHRLCAHTLVDDERSAGVLRASGFAEADRISHPEEGEVLRWERAVASD